MKKGKYSKLKFLRKKHEDILKNKDLQAMTSCLDDNIDDIANEEVNLKEYVEKSKKTLPILLSKLYD